MQGRRNPFVAREGIPFLLVAMLACWLAWRHLDLAWLASIGLLTIWLLLIFRDPRRRIPSAPLAVVSPVDGKVMSVERKDGGVLQGSAQVIRLRIDSFGTYTARCPVEGKIMDLRQADDERRSSYRKNALWVQTDEGDDVVLLFDGYRFGLPPRSFVRYGERLGQGARCAYLRLARVAVLHLPVDSKVRVEAGQRVVAGRDQLARLPQSS